ncbi:MAG: LuxR C-terminal-related transcriptional regulator [Longimicrobiales bacterium]
MMERERSTDARKALSLLEEGRTDEARALLGNAADPSALAMRLHAVLTNRRPVAGYGEAGARFGPDDADDPDTPAVRTLDHVLRASEALRSGHTETLVAEARAARADAPDHPWLLLNVGSVLQAAYRFTGRPALRAEALETLAAVADRTDRPHTAVAARALLGNIHMMHGAFHRALDRCEAALALATATGLADHPAAAMGHQFRGYVLYEWNRLDEAAGALKRAWSLAGPERRGVASGVARMLARVEATRGRQDEADRWLGRLERIVAEPMTLRNREWLAAVQAGRSLGPGDLKAVDAWMTTYDYRPDALLEMSDAAIRARLHEIDTVLTLLEATRQWPALRTVAPKVAGAAGTERAWYAVRAHSAEAVALAAEGRHDPADVALGRALELGAPGGFVRAFLDGSPLRRTLLERAASASAPGAALHHARAVLASDSSGSPAPAALTPAQMDVLRRVADGGSNRAVARELGVSVSTVRTHLRAIFRRLDAASRTEAVARGRALGIL